MRKSLNWRSTQRFLLVFFGVLLMAFILILSVLCGLFGSWLAQYKGRHPIYGFVIGLVLGPLVIFMIFVKKRENKCNGE